MKRRFVSSASLLLLAGLSVACGSRMPHDQIVAAWNAGNRASGPAAAQATAPMPAAPATGSASLSATGDGLSGPGAPTPGRASNPGSTPGATTRAGAAGSGTGTPGGQTASTPTAPTPGAAPGGSLPTTPTVPGGASKGSGGEILAGSVSTISGPIGASIGGGVRAVQAWVAMVNAVGGVNGHTVKFLVADDGADPARHRTLVQQLVEQDKVSAFVYLAAPISGQSAVPYLEGKKIPAIGTEAGSPWVYTSPVYFPQVASFEYLPFVFAGPVAQEAKKEGKSKIAVFTCEFASCKAVLNGDGFRSFGLNVVHEASMSVTQPDYTAECLSARNAGAEIVFVQLSPDGIIRFLESCKNIGYGPLYAIEGQTMSPLFLKRPELEGAIFSSPATPFFVNLPATNEFRTAMARFAPKEEVNISSELGWISAKLFERAVLHSTSATVTSADILAGLTAVKDDDLGGLTMPLTFDAGAANNKTHAQPCWWTIRIRSGQWTSPDDGQRHCRA